MPHDIDIGLVERPHPRGPYGAKGVGETGTFAVSPAIANALADATGLRLRGLPLTPEKVLRGLHAKNGGILA